MQKLKQSVLSIFVLVALLALSVPFLSAQSDLSDEELALLDRVAAAVEAAEEPESYVSLYQSEAGQNLEVSMGDTSQIILDSSTVFAERTVTLGENPYGTALYELVATQDAGMGAASYVLEAEFRFIDGTLYAQAAYVETEGDVPPVPEGWFIVDDPLAYAFLDLMNVEELLETFGVVTDEDAEEEDGDSLGDGLLDILPAIRDSATAVTLEADELDGTPVDVIQIAFGWDAVLAILESQGNAPPEDDPVFALFERELAGVSDAGNAIYVLDADDNVIGFGTELVIELTEIDMGEIDPSAAGAMMDSFIISNNEVEIVSSVGEAFEVPEVPELAPAG